LGVTTYVLHDGYAIADYGSYILCPYQFDAAYYTGMYESLRGRDNTELTGAKTQVIGLSASAVKVSEIGHVRSVSDDLRLS